MKLDRNINPDGKGKYALIKLRRTEIPLAELGEMNTITIDRESIDFGETDETEFFVIRLKDKYAEAALSAYGKAAAEDDKEYAQEILTLAAKAANHPNQKKPD